MAGKKPVINVAYQVDKITVNKEALQSALNRINPTVTVRVKTAKDQLQSELNRYKSLTITPMIKFGKEATQQILASLNGKEFVINPTIDLKNINKGLDAVESRMKKLGMAFNSGFDPELQAAKVARAQQSIARTSFKTDLQYGLAKSGNLGNFSEAEKNAEKLINTLTATDNATIKVKNDLIAMMNAFRSGTMAPAQFSQYKDAIMQLDQQINLVNSHGRSMGDIFKKSFEKFSIWFSASAIILSLVRTLKNAITYVMELDKSLTEIQIVVPGIDKTALAKSYNDLAKEMKVDTLEVASAAATFFRQGLTTAQVEERLKSVIEYAKISSLEFAQAAEIVTATTNAMGVSAQRTADVFSYLGDATAAGADEIGIAMQYTASIAASAGVQFEKLGSWIATVSDKTRLSAEIIGTSFKTILARVQEIKNAGATEEDNITFNRVAKALAQNAEIFVTQEDMFTNFGKVLDELGAKWSKLSRGEQNAIATVMAGARQIDRFLALMNNYSESIDLYGQSLNAAGTADRKFQTYQEGLEAQVAKTKTEFEGLWQSLIDKGTITGILILFQSLGSALTTLVRAFGGFSTIATLVMFSWLTFGKTFKQFKFDFFKDAQSIQATSKATTTVIQTSAGQITVAVQEGSQKVQQSMEQTATKTGGILNNLKGIVKNAGNSIGGVFKSIGKSILNGLANAAISAGISAVIGLVISGISKLITFADDAHQAIQQFASDMESLRTSGQQVINLEAQIKQYNELLNKTDKSIEDNTQLLDLQTQINSTLQNQSNQLDYQNDSYDTTIFKLKEIGKLQASNWLTNLENEDKMNKAREAGREYYDGSGHKWTTTHPEDNIQAWEGGKTFTPAGELPNGGNFFAAQWWSGAGVSEEEAFSKTAGANIIYNMLHGIDALNNSVEMLDMTKFSNMVKQLDAFQQLLKSYSEGKVDISTVTSAYTDFVSQFGALGQSSMEAFLKQFGTTPDNLGNVSKQTAGWMSDSINKLLSDSSITTGASIRDLGVKYGTAAQTESMQAMMQIFAQPNAYSPLVDTISNSTQQAIKNGAKPEDIKKIIEDGRSQLLSQLKSQNVILNETDAQTIVDAWLPLPTDAQIASATGSITADLLIAFTKAQDKLELDLQQKNQAKIDFLKLLLGNFKAGDVIPEDIVKQISDIFGDEFLGTLEQADGQYKLTTAAAKKFGAELNRTKLAKYEDGINKINGALKEYHEIGKVSESTLYDLQQAGFDFSGMSQESLVPVLQMISSYASGDEQAFNSAYNAMAGFFGLSPSASGYVNAFNDIIIAANNGQVAAVELAKRLAELGLLKVSYTTERVPTFDENGALTGYQLVQVPHFSMGDIKPVSTASGGGGGGSRSTSAKNAKHINPEINDDSWIYQAVTDQVKRQLQDINRLMQNPNITEQEMINLRQQELALLEKQKQAIQDEIDANKRMAEQLKSEIEGQYGISWEGENIDLNTINATLIDLNNQRNAIAEQMNALIGATDAASNKKYDELKIEYDKISDQYEYLLELAQDYQDILNSNADLMQDIADIDADLLFAGDMGYENLIDRIWRWNAALQAVESQLANVRAAMQGATGADLIALQKQEIDLLNQKKQIIESTQSARARELQDAENMLKNEFGIDVAAGDWQDSVADNLAQRESLIASLREKMQENVNDEVLFGFYQNLYERAQSDYDRLVELAQEYLDIQDQNVQDATAILEIEQEIAQIQLDALKAQLSFQQKLQDIEEKREALAKLQNERNIWTLTKDGWQLKADQAAIDKAQEDLQNAVDSMADGIGLTNDTLYDMRSLLELAVLALTGSTSGIDISDYLAQISAGTMTYSEAIAAILQLLGYTPTASLTPTAVDVSTSGNISAPSINPVATSGGATANSFSGSGVTVIVQNLTVQTDNAENIINSLINIANTSQ